MDHFCNEGSINLYFVNYKTKEVGMDWVYCNICYPGNTCTTYFGNLDGWRFIEISDYDKYLKEGYKEVIF